MHTNPEAENSNKKERGGERGGQGLVYVGVGGCGCGVELGKWRTLEGLGWGWGEAPSPPAAKGEESSEQFCPFPPPFRNMCVLSGRCICVQMW